MALENKYQPLIDSANAHGVSDLQIREQDSVLYIDGVAPSEDVKTTLWEVYNQIDPDYAGGDLVLNIQVDQGNSAYDEYEVQSGDTLSKIGANYGVPWRTIYEANSELIENPNLIQIGWKLKVPKKNA